MTALVPADLPYAAAVGMTTAFLLLKIRFPRRNDLDKIGASPFERGRSYFYPLPPTAVLGEAASQMQMLPWFILRTKAGGPLRLPDALDQEPSETYCGANMSDIACSSITNLGIPIDPGATSYSSKTMTRLPDSSR